LTGGMGIRGEEGEGVVVLFFLCCTSRFVVLLFPFLERSVELRPADAHTVNPTRRRRISAPDAHLRRKLGEEENEERKQLWLRRRTKGRIQTPASLCTPPHHPPSSNPLRHKRTSIRNARIAQLPHFTTLLIPHPLAPHSLLLPLFLLLQRRERAKEYPDRVAAADGVLRETEVGSEEGVGG
jgi:hypothetical protein